MTSEGKLAANIKFPAVTENMSIPSEMQAI